MNRGVFTDLTRRASLRTLGAVGLTALAPYSAIEARKKRRKKRNRGDPNKLCKKQIEQCIAFFAPICGDDVECLEVFDRCCLRLGTCDFDGFFFCAEAG